MWGKIFAVGILLGVVGVVGTLAVKYKAPGWKNATCDKLPEFSNYSVAKIFDGARPPFSGRDLNLSDWGKEVASATNSAVNYAGDYVVKTKACQKFGCVQHLMVNVRTGVVVNMGLYGKYEAKYRPDSTLFVLEATATTSAQKTFYKINNDKMELVCIQ